MRTHLIYGLLWGALGLIPTLASAATITVVHGINGADIGAARTLPVDIAVGSSCALTGVTFGASAQVELAAGAYQISVSPSNGKCSNSAVIKQEVRIPAGAKNIGLVAHINDSGAPALKAFVNDAQAGAIVVNNASSGPAIWAGVGFKSWIFYSASPFANGTGKAIAGFGENRRLQVALMRENQRRPFFRKTFKAGSSLVLYIVGSRKNGQLIVEERIGNS